MATPSTRTASETARPGAEPEGNWLERAWSFRGRDQERQEVWRRRGAFDAVGVAQQRRREKWRGRGQTPEARKEAGPRSDRI